jgi:hypothetical protein
MAAVLREAELGRVEQRSVLRQIELVGLASIVEAGICTRGEVGAAA